MMISDILIKIHQEHDTLYNEVGLNGLNCLQESRNKSVHHWSRLTNSVMRALQQYSLTENLNCSNRSVGFLFLIHKSEKLVHLDLLTTSLNRNTLIWRQTIITLLLSVQMPLLLLLLITITARILIVY